MEEFNESEMFRVVLNEVLTDLKQLQSIQKEMNKLLASLSEKVDAFTQRLDNLKIESPPIDLQPVKDQLAECVAAHNERIEQGMQRVQDVFAQYMKQLADAVAAQPKPIIRRLCLFPETDRNGHFKFLVTRVVWWSLGVFLLVAAFSLIQQYIARPAQERYVTREQYAPETVPPPTQQPHKVKIPRKKQAKDTTSYAAADTLQ